jgi:transposase
MKLKKVTTWNDIIVCPAIGIDVCKRHLDIAGLREGAGYNRRITNDSRAIAGFVKALVRHSFRGTILCEATSHYHILLTVMLCESGLDVRVINPLLSSKHAKSSIRKTKTDRVDARVLAVMVLTEPDLPPPLKLTRSQCAVRHTLGLIHSQEKHLQGMNRALASYRERMGQLDLTTGKAYRQTAKAMEKLEQCHEKLLAELESYLLEIRPEQQEVVRRVTEVPGITRRNAALFTFVLDPTVKGAKSWMAYAGLDVGIKESGTWRGRGRITKRGPAWLRKRLIQAAWGTAMTYPQGRCYYDYLKAKGRKHKEALVIMARKLLSIIYSLMVDGKTFDHTKAFQIVA